MTPRDAARTYASLGWLVFPLIPNEKRPATEHGLLDASRDAGVIDQWWDENPARNVGVVTSRSSGIWVLDEDVDHETGELIGEKTLADLLAKHGELPPHPIARTPRGGRHHVFAYPEDGQDLPRKIKFAPGLDALGSRLEDGGEKAGYFGAYPSVVGNGRYQWDVLPSKVKPPQAPAWLVEMVRAEPEAQPFNGEAVLSDHTTAYGRRALEDECAKLAGTPPGAQDDTLIRIATRIGSLVAAGEIENGEARSSLLAAGMKMVNSGRPWTPRELEGKIERGFKYAAKSPYKKREREQSVAALPASPIKSSSENTAQTVPPQPILQLVVNNQLVDASPKIENWMMGLPWQVKKREDPDLKWNLKPAEAINCQLMIQHHPQIKGIYAYNKFSDQVVILRGIDGQTAGYPRQITDADDAELCAWLNWHGIGPPLTMARTYLRTIAMINSFDPLEEYLMPLKWDGTPRIDNWLTYYAGAEPSDYVRLVGRKYLISAVARGLRPGCKVDAMLILEGIQALGKSTLAYILFGSQFFSDQVGDVRNKDAAERIQGVWGIEIPEMDKFSRVEANAVKSFLSQRDDRYRAAYAHNTATRKRRCVFFGTINPDGMGYLRDTTGNRRFWPVAVTSIAMDDLIADRDQIWAEAKHAFENNERWWLDRDDEDITMPQQKARQLQTVFEPKVIEWVKIQDANEDGYIKFHMHKLLEYLGIEKTKMDAFSGKIGPILRDLGMTTGNNKGRYWEIKRENLRKDDE